MNQFPLHHNECQPPEEREAILALLSWDQEANGDLCPGVGRQREQLDAAYAVCIDLLQMEEPIEPPPDLSKMTARRTGLRTLLPDLLKFVEEKSRVMPGD
jgi:hypothetical protein